MTPEQEVLFLQWLIDECGYRRPRPIGDGRYAAIYRKAFTHAIVIGRFGDYHGVDDNWCYPDCASASAALDAWDGRGEPGGWTRHPASGRRVAPPEGAHDNAGRRVAAGERYVRG